MVGVGLAVDGVAENGVTEGFHVDAQLVAASGFGIEVYPGEAVFSPCDLVAGDGGFPFFGVDDVNGGIVAGPIFAEGGVDSAFVGGQFAGEDGVIDFLDAALFELSAEVGLGGGMEGKNHEAGGVAVEAMDEADVFLGMLALQAGPEGVRLVRGASGNGEESVGFDDHEQVVVGMEDGNGGHGKGPFFCASGLFQACFRPKAGVR